MELVAEQAARLDHELARLQSQFSRSKLQRWVRDGRVRVNGEVCLKPGTTVVPGDRVDIRVPDMVPNRPRPTAIAFDVLHEDADVVVVNKPAGLIVHPGVLNEPETLVHGLLFKYPDMADAFPEDAKRPGIVHRLDKGTSGVMVVARSESARLRLVQQFQQRQVGKLYWAWVIGVPPANGVWDGAIARHPRDRKRFSVRPEGKPAESRFRVTATWQNLSARLEIELLTGRTHQIRVHTTNAGYPLLGDPVYRKRGRLPQALTRWTEACGRPALHACQLTFAHPSNGRSCRFEAPLPKDLVELDRNYVAV